MMLINQIKQRQIQARKSKEGDVVINLLTTLYSEATMAGKNANIPHETTDNEVIAVVKKFIKTTNECQTIANERHDINWLNKLDIEETLLKSFLPPQLTEEELTGAILGIMSKHGLTGIKSTGMIMKTLKEQYDGLYDGKMASELVKTILTTS